MCPFRKYGFSGKLGKAKKWKPLIPQIVLISDDIARQKGNRILDLYFSLKHFTGFWQNRAKDWVAGVADLLWASPWISDSPQSRLRRWSFFYNDGMVMFFFQGTIVIDGFSMVLPSLDHHHWMFFYRSTIEIDGFSMVFPNSGAMVSDGFDLEKDLKMRKIATNLILRQLCVSSRIQMTLLLVKFKCK